MNKHQKKKKLSEAAQNLLKLDSAEILQRLGADETLIATLVELFQVPDQGNRLPPPTEDGRRELFEERPARAGEPSAEESGHVSLEEEVVFVDRVRPGGSGSRDQMRIGGPTRRRQKTALWKAHLVEGIVVLVFWYDFCADDTEIVDPPAQGVERRGNLGLV